MKRFIAIVFIFATLSSHAEEDYLFIADPYMTPMMGAEDLISIQQGLMRLEDHWFPRKCPPRRTFAAGLGRFTEMIAIWNPINYTAMVTQHEVFGHGYRVLDIGERYVKLRKFHIGAPFPYGSGGGYTAFNPNSKMSSTQLMATSMAGVESTAIMATRLKLRWLKEGRIDARQTTLYDYSQQDLTYYILSLHEDSDFPEEGTIDEDEGHDIGNYLKILNDSFTGGHLSKAQLKRLSLINLIDPFTYYSIYGWWNYVFTGRDMTIPMIPIGSVRYLPAARLGLTPFGPEYFLENFLVAKDVPIYAYFKGGSYGENRYWGLGVEDGQVIKRDNYSLGFRLDLWLQPKLTLHQIPLKEYINGRCCDVPFQPNRTGGALSLIGTYKMAFAQIGYKTKGFLPGESLENSPIIRLGIQGQF